MWLGAIPYAIVTTPHVKYARGKFQNNRNFSDNDGLVAGMVLDKKVEGKEAANVGPGGTQLRAAVAPAAFS